VKLYISQLIDKNACQSQVDLFRSKFGESVDVTPELCARVATEFEFCWAAGNLLSDSAGAEYDRAMAPARAKYSRASRALYKYECEPSTAEKVAWTEFMRARAIAFANAYNTMEAAQP
jgi:hypothetical protein